MAVTYSQPGALGTKAPDFKLPCIDGKTYSLADFFDTKALVVVFMCNHCPYVIAVQKRINALAKEFAPKGVRLVGINSNDSTKYKEDSFEAMKQRTREQHFVFPYLFDENQDAAKSYGAVCTPDFYLYAPSGSGSEIDFVLRYRGRLDDSWKDESAVKIRDLALAIDCILEGKPIPAEQIASMGCSIKWKE